jgi:tetratricopeptide (TPR) repeat protein
VGGERALASPAVRAFEQAVKLFNRQEFQRAREAFQAVIERFPQEAEVVARARAYLAICEQRLRAPRPVPRTAEALYDRGIIELNRGQIVPAIAFFEKALKLDPRADHAVYALAAAYARGGQVEKALAMLRQAIAMRETYRLHARRDPDFYPLLANPEFQKLVGIEVLE